jgi:hypothetical protein
VALHVVYDLGPQFPLSMRATLAGPLSSDDRIAAAQSGWAGSSALALSAKTAAWLEDSRRLVTGVALDLSNDGIAFSR